MVCRTTAVLRDTTLNTMRRNNSADAFGILRSSDGITTRTKWPQNEAREELGADAQSWTRTHFSRMGHR